MAYTFALIYSGVDKQLDVVIQTIRNDRVLSQKIHLVCVDTCPGAREHLRHNASGVSVHDLPVFAVRHAKEPKPTIYPIHLADHVYRQVYAVSGARVKEQDWSTSYFKANGPVYLKLSPGDRLRFVSPYYEEHDLVEDAPEPRIDYKKSYGFTQDVAFDIPGVYSLVSTTSKDMRIVVDVGDTNSVLWNLDAFPEGKSLERKASIGEKIYLVSTDGLIHNVTLNGNVLVQDKVYLCTPIVIDPIYFRPGTNTLTCTHYPDRMRLRVTIEEKQLKTFAQRQVKRKDISVAEVLSGIYEYDPKDKDNYSHQE